MGSLTRAAEESHGGSLSSRVPEIPDPALRAGNFGVRPSGLPRDPRARAPTELAGLVGLEESSGSSLRSSEVRVVGRVRHQGNPRDL